MKRIYPVIFTIILIFFTSENYFSQSQAAEEKDKSDEFSQQKLQTQYEEKVTNSLKNYLKTLKKSGYSRTTKNLLKYKSKNKAQAFCFDWDRVVPSAINDQKNYEIISAGNSWNYATKNQAKATALEWCNQRPATQTGQCECEVLNLNGKFSLSPVAKEKIANYVNSIAVAKKAEEEKIQKELAAKKAEEEKIQKELAAKKAEEDRKQKELAAKKAEEERKQKELAAKKAEEERKQKELAAKAREAEEESVRKNLDEQKVKMDELERAIAAKSPTAKEKIREFKLFSEDFIKDLKTFVKEPNELDIIRVGELLSNFNSYKNSEWDLNRLDAFNKIYKYTLSENGFQRFFVQKIQTRKNNALKAEQDVILFLGKSVDTLKSFIGSNLGTVPADKAIQLAKKIKNTLEDFRINDGINLIEELNEWKNSNNVIDQNKLSDRVVEFIISQKQQDSQKELAAKKAEEERKQKELAAKKAEEERKQKELAAKKAEEESDTTSNDEVSLDDSTLLLQIVNAQLAGDLATIVELVPLLTDEKSKQTEFYPLVIVTAMNHQNCDVGRTFIGKLSNADEREEYTNMLNVFCSNLAAVKGITSATNAVTSATNAVTAAANAVTSVAKAKEAVTSTDDPRGVKGCSHSYVDSAGETFSFIKFALDYDQIDSIKGLAKVEKKNGSIQAIGTIFTKNGIPVERIGDLIYWFEDGKFSNTQNWLPEKINKDEFVADFGKYPKVTCKVVGME